MKVIASVGSATQALDKKVLGLRVTMISEGIMTRVPE
jgi:hypothetical protein